MKLLIINGPNLNMLGIREKEIYGTKTYDDLVVHLERVCEKNSFECEVYQSNHEGDIVDKIQNAYGKIDGIVINPAAYTHTSVAILDALKAVSIPAVEVHLSEVDKRESFRQISYVREYCIDTFSGHGFESYTMAIEKLSDYLKK